jgi:hypothetical protein
MAFLRNEILSIRLEGTERQIQWAESLRLQKIVAFERMGNRAVLRHLKPLLIEADIRVMGLFTPEGLGMLATHSVIMAMRHREARWWIDNRDANPLEWLSPAYSSVAAAYLRTPPHPNGL